MSQDNTNEFIPIRLRRPTNITQSVVDAERDRIMNRLRNTPSINTQQVEAERDRIRGRIEDYNRENANNKVKLINLSTPTIIERNTSTKQPIVSDSIQVVSIVRSLLGIANRVIGLVVESFDLEDTLNGRRRRTNGHRDELNMLEQIELYNNEDIPEEEQLQQMRRRDPFEMALERNRIADEQDRIDEQTILREHPSMSPEPLAEAVRQLQFQRMDIERAEWQVRTRDPNLSGDAYEEAVRQQLQANADELAEYHRRRQEEEARLAALRAQLLVEHRAREAEQRRVQEAEREWIRLESEARQLTEELARREESTRLIEQEARQRETQINSRNRSRINRMRDTEAARDARMADAERRRTELIVFAQNPNLSGEALAEAVRQRQAETRAQNEILLARMRANRNSGV